MLLLKDDFAMLILLVVDADCPPSDGNSLSNALTGLGWVEGGGRWEDAPGDFTAPLYGITKLDMKL